MIIVAGCAVAVVGINLVLLLFVRGWTDQALKERTNLTMFRRGWRPAVGAVLRLVIFFGGAQVVWEKTGNPGMVVAFIFATAVAQMSLTIFLHLKNRI